MSVRKLKDLIGLENAKAVLWANMGGGLKKIEDIDKIADEYEVEEDSLMSVLWKGSPAAQGALDYYQICYRDDLKERTNPCDDRKKGKKCLHWLGIDYESITK